MTEIVDRDSKTRTAAMGRAMRDVLRSRIFKVLAVVMVATLLVSAVSAGLSHDLEGGTIPLPGTNSTASSRSGLSHPVTRQSNEATLVSYKRSLLPEDKPGEIVEPGCVLSGRIGGHYPTNRWSAGGAKGDRYLRVEVCAGELSDEPGTGYLTVSKSWYPGEKRLDYEAYIPHSGAVRITDAPLGQEASKMVWEGPRIWFEGVTGISGYLDLQTDAIRITAGPESGVCPEGTAGMPPDCLILRPYLSDFRVTPKVRWKRRGQTFSFLVEVTNSGNAPATKLNFCVETPRHMIKGGWWNCFVFEQLPAGATVRHRFRFKLTKRVKPGRKYTIGIVAGTPMNYGYVTWSGTKYTQRTVRILK